MAASAGRMPTHENPSRWEIAPVCVVHEHFPNLLRALLTRQAQQYLRWKQAEKACTRSRGGDRMAHHQPEHAGYLIMPAMEKEEEDTGKEHVVGVFFREYAKLVYHFINRRNRMST